MKIRPLGDQVVVIPEKDKRKSESGIEVATVTKKIPNKGKVIAVGAGKVREDDTNQMMEVKIGDMVLYSKYAGESIDLDIDGELTEVVVLSQDSIYAIL